VSSEVNREVNRKLNNGWTYYDQIKKTDAVGQSVLNYYTQRYQHSTREEWRSRIHQGQILLNGERVAAQTALQLNQSLSYFRPPWHEPNVPLTFEILYEDADLWVINKPSGLPVLPGGGFLEHTLLHQMRLHYPEAVPVPVHRLGRGTSGAMLVAKSHAARNLLARQFRVRTAELGQSISPSNSPSNRLSKVYRTLVGPASINELSDRFTCNHPIGKLPYPGLDYLYGHCPQGLPARSDCTVLQRRADATLIEVAISTGRPHQIRIHLAAAGYPLLGDPLYAAGGVPIVNGTAMPGECGYHLHAHRLQFVHPSSGEVMQIVAALPAALKMRDEG